MEKDLNQKEQIKKLPNARIKQIDRLKKDKRLEVEGFIDAIEASGLEEFMEYIRSPWKMLWPNFVAGVARGLGALVGATIVIALVWWFLSTLIDIPLIGKKLQPFVEQIQTEIRDFTESTNYRPNFERMEKSLESIDQSLKKSKP